MKRVRKVMKMKPFSAVVETGRLYDIIYSDPPWPYRDQGIRGGVKKHYETLSLEEIKLLPVPAIAAPESFLFLWATNPMIQEALDVMKAWGFEYKTIGFTWIKVNKGQKLHDYFVPGEISDFMGTGRYTRANAENCLLGVKGNKSLLHKMIMNRGVRSTVFSYRGSHSQKPDEVRKRILLLLGDRPRIELFARGKPPAGWDVWGDGVDELA
jgi:N6-adenosine-specific RNA methylase IME4